MLARMDPIIIPPPDPHCYYCHSKGMQLKAAKEALHFTGKDFKTKAVFTSKPLGLPPLKLVLKPSTGKPISDKIAA